MDKNNPEEEEAMKRFIASNENSETRETSEADKVPVEAAIIDAPAETIKDNSGKIVSFGSVRNREYEGRQDAHESLTSKYGWQRILMDNLPSRRKGLNFYPADFQITIRSADVPQVRHWSEINEEDAFSIDNAFNDMLLACCKVSMENGQGSYKDLLEEDRIYILFEIRALTYPEAEHNLTFKHACPECDYDNDLLLDNDHFQAMDIDETMGKYYDTEKECFIVKTKTYGGIIIKPPTIGIMQAVSKYLQELRQANKKIDMTFIKILPYIAGTWKGLNAKRIKEINVTYQGWNEKRFSLMLDLCSKARIGVKPEMFTDCKSCGSEVTAPITFPGGVKALFIVSDFSSELL